MLAEGRRSTMSGGYASSERSLAAIKNAERGTTAFVTGCGSATPKPEEPVNVYLAVCLGNNGYKVRSAYAEHWLSMIDTFHSAAIGAQSWETALRGFADVTGSRSAQLTGVGQDGSVLFNVLTNIDPPALHSMFAATATINPRVKAAGRAPVLKVGSRSSASTWSTAR